MNILEIKGLCKNYNSFCLSNVSFSVPKGTITGFIGRNGAGKTTTLKAILRVIHNDGGTVLFNGADTKECETEFKENIGVVLGGIDFYRKKKLKTVAKVTSKFYSSWDNEKYKYYLDFFGLDENKRVDELSAGMGVKFMIALALSHNAKLLILDEPTSGLDPVSRDELTELFSAIVKDKERSILFSTHITSDLEKCARNIVFIKDGKILFDGTKEDFMNDFKDKGETLEDIIVAVERRKIDESAII